MSHTFYFVLRGSMVKLKTFKLFVTKWRYFTVIIMGTCPDEVKESSWKWTVNNRNRGIIIGNYDEHLNTLMQLLDMLDMSWYLSNRYWDLFLLNYLPFQILYGNSFSWKNVRLWIHRFSLHVFYLFRWMNAMR